MTQPDLQLVNNVAVARLAVVSMPSLSIPTRVVPNETLEVLLALWWHASGGETLMLDLVLFWISGSQIDLLYLVCSLQVT